MRRKRKFEPGEVVVAAESFSVDLQGVVEGVRAGERLLGSNPLVRGWPQFFGRDADPADVAAVRRQLRDEASAQALASSRLDSPGVQILGKIPAPHRLRATRDAMVHDSSGAGVVVHCGEICDARSDVVQLLRKTEGGDLFEPAPAD